MYVKVQVSHTLTQTCNDLYKFKVQYFKRFVKVGPSAQLINEQVCERDSKICLAGDKSGNPRAHSTHGLTERVPPQLTLLTEGPIKICSQD